MTEKKEKDDKTQIKILDKIVPMLNRAHGEGIVFQLNKTSSVGLVRDRISSGSLMLDRALGGGWVRGTLNEIFGHESSGKSTVCLHTMAEAQKYGEVLFVDTEHAFDPVYAKALGVDVSRIYMCQPYCAEQAFDVIEAFVRSPELSLIVVDSIAGLVPRTEVEGDPGDSNMGVAARLNRQHLRKLIHPLNQNKIVALYTNQITYKIVPFGNPETTTGGTGYKYYTSTRTRIAKVSTQKDNMAKSNIHCQAVVQKNKTAIPLQVAEFDIEFGQGVNRGGELLDLGVEAGVIEKSGSWYALKEDGSRLGQGRVNASQAISETPEFEDAILKGIFPKQEEVCTSQTQEETLSD